MSTAALRKRTREVGDPGPLGLGVATVWLSLIVLLPLAAVVARSAEAGFWDAVTSKQALSALQFTLVVSLVCAAFQAVMGTVLAWVLVRDDFRGKAIVNGVVDLPFALPTIVAGLTLLALYGNESPVGIDISFTRTAVLFALLFVTLPFVVRSVQPVLLSLEREAEEAAASLGARPSVTFRKVILPALRPAILSGAALAFARAVGEFGSIVLISGNIPNETQVSSVYIFKQLESDDLAGAAATSVVLLGISLAVLIVLRFVERRQHG